MPQFSRFRLITVALLLNALLSLLLSGCSDTNGQGSGNIFDDPPECFYDVLFGCGTFDIPGNSSYYGYTRFARESRIAAVSSGNSIPNFSGNWKGMLDRKASSCKFATPLRINASFSVKQLKDRVTLKLPISTLSTYPLRGKASNKGISASTTGYASFCSFQAGSILNSRNTRSGTFNINVRVKCPFQASCDIGYNGNVKK